MSPAPKNPTPEGTAAETRAASHVIVEDRNAICPHIVKRHDPRDTSDIVRIPAGLSADFRSKLHESK